MPKDRSNIATYTPPIWVEVSFWGPDGFSLNPPSPWHYRAQIDLGFRLKKTGLFKKPTVMLVQAMHGAKIFRERQRDATQWRNTLKEAIAEVMGAKGYHTTAKRILLPREALV